LIPAVVTPAEITMCYRDKAAEYRQTQEKCLATMIYGEARGEAFTGKVAVAYTALNRAVNRPLCDVILQPKQYSIFNGSAEWHAAATDPLVEPAQENKADEEGWQDSLRAAKLVMAGEVSDPSNGSTHYISDRVMKLKKYKYPKWSRTYVQVAKIGEHRFFKQNI